MQHRILVPLAVGILALAGCASQPSEPTTAPAPSGADTCEYRPAGQAAKPVDPPATDALERSGTIAWTLQFDQGPVTLTLDRGAAPCTVNSFSALAQQGYFTDSDCHRLVDRGIYVLQCGDPTGTGRGGPGYRFDDELTGQETYSAGTVAMANAGPNTNGSQFFIVWADSPLPPDYTVFGHIDEESLAVVRGIADEGVSTENSPNPASRAHISAVSAG